jgi:hypothetical protein
MITSLRAMDEEIGELLLAGLFNAYRGAADETFATYMRETEVKWEERVIPTLTAEELMQIADARYKVLVEKKEWPKPTKAEADLMALKASITELTTLKAEVVKKPSSGAAGTGAARAPRGKGPRVNDGEWAWKNVPWDGKGPKEKTFKGKVYVHCPFHPGTQWVLKAGHENSCRNDPNFIKGIDKMTAAADDKKEAPSKKTLQFAQALMAAMDAEANGELADEET